MVHHTRMRTLALLAGSLLAGCAAPPPVDPSTELARGADLAQRLAFAPAATAFAAAREASAPGSPERLRATLGLAVALQHEVPIDLAQVARAAELCEEVVREGGRSPLAARAALNRGRIAELRDVQADAIDLPEARRWYQRVIDGWPDEAIAGEATLRLAGAWIQTLVPEEVRRGIALCEERAARPGEPWAGALWKQAGDAWWVCLRERAAAVRCLVRCLESGHPEPSLAGLTAWRIATLAEEDGQREVAIAHYRRIIERHPSSGRAWDAQNRLRALGVEPPAIDLVIMPVEGRP